VCANEKRKQCNRIQSDITLGRNYPTAGYLTQDFIFFYQHFNKIISYKQNEE